jgi:hypothetical protein
LAKRASVVPADVISELEAALGASQSPKGNGRLRSTVAGGAAVA